MRMPQTCGNENSDITCSFFFRTIDNAFRDETVLYTLRKSFFPTQGAPPASFDVFMTLSIESVPDISCNDPYFKERSINSPPSMRYGAIIIIYIYHDLYILPRHVSYLEFDDEGLDCVGNASWKVVSSKKVNSQLLF